MLGCQIDLREIGWDDMDWTDVTQDSNQLFSAR
jgi:hypothetical protein